MPKSLDLLACLPALLAAAESRSATQAARTLSTTPATVLRRIDAVERELGVPLFTRMPTGLLPTRELALVLPWAEQAVGAVDGMQREVAGLDVAPRGTVRIAMPPALAEHLLLPAVPRFRADHPGLVIEIATSTSVVDLARREADLALRVIRPGESELVRKKVADYEMVIAISAELAARCESIDDVPWVTWDRTMDHIPEARWLRATRPRAQIAMTAADLSTLLTAARLGVGALVVSEGLAAAVPGLVRIPTAAPILSGTLWLVAHRALRKVPRVDIAWHWVLAQAAVAAADSLPLVSDAERFLRRAKR